MDVYTPSKDKVIHQTYVDLNKRGVSKPIHLVQYDHGLPIVEVNLYSDGFIYTLPEESYVNIRLKKPDGKVVYNPVLGCNESRDAVYVEITYQMTTHFGNFTPILEIVVNDKVASSSTLTFEIDKNPIQEDDEASTDERKVMLDYLKEAETQASNAATSASKAKTSENNAKTSETNAANSASSAANSSAAAYNSAQNSIDAADASKQYRDQSKGYSINASNSATVAAGSASNAATSESKAKTSETNAKTSEDKAKKYADDIYATVDKKIEDAITKALNTPI